MRGKTVPSLKFYFSSSDDGNSVAVRVFDVVSQVPEEKQAAMMDAMNRCNKKFRYVKFFMEEDKTLTASYDMPQEGANVGDVAFEILVRFMKIIDEAYPEFMKVLWG